MTTTPDEPLGDGDMTTESDAPMPGATPGTDADSTDADSTDGDSTDAGDGDSTDADGTDADGTDGTDGSAL